MPPIGETLIFELGQNDTRTHPGFWQAPQSLSHCHLSVHFNFLDTARGRGLSQMQFQSDLFEFTARNFSYVNSTLLVAQESVSRRGTRQVSGQTRKAQGLTSCK